MEQESEKLIEDFKKKVQEMKEFELFLAIESLSSILWKEKHEFFHGRLEMSENKFKDNQEYYHTLQKECVLMLKQFNVDTESVNDKPNGSYWKWYQFWKNWMNDFSEEERKDFEKRFEKNENVDDLLPKKRWNE